MRVLLAGLLVMTAQSADAGCALLDKFDAFSTSNSAPEQAICATYLTAAATTGASCHWTFGFRDPAALTFADELWTELTVCRGGAHRADDQRVNHPDSYDLREWAAERGVYAISVKDKGALNSTLVFLRFEPVSSAR